MKSLMIDPSRRRRTIVAGAVLFAMALVVALQRRRVGRHKSIAEETRRVRERYNREAHRYDKVIRVPERLLFGDGRTWAASQATGDVLEIAAGTGRNLPYYPSELRLTLQDVSDSMLAIARERARELCRDVEFQVGDAQQLPFADAQFDTVVCTLSLCTIPDDRRALAEAWRVLRPGGRLILLEHVRSPRLLVRGVQRLLDPLMVRLAADHLLREPLDYLGGLGFSVEYCERSRAGIVERMIAPKSSSRAA